MVQSFFPAGLIYVIAIIGYFIIAKQKVNGLSIKKLPIHIIFVGATILDCIVWLYQVPYGVLFWDKTSGEQFTIYILIAALTFTYILNLDSKKE